MSGSGVSTLPQELTSASVPELIVRLQTEHGDADRICKHVQAFREEAGIPAINEMRYAGYYVTLALNPAGPIEDRDNLVKAIGHVQRAAYEAAEAGILNCLDQISLFKDEYRLVQVSPVVSDWISILEKANAARDRLGAPRQTGDDRWLDHCAHAAIFDDLVEACRRLDTAREELNKSMLENRRSTRRWRATTGLAILGVLLAGLSLVVHLKDAQKTSAGQLPSAKAAQPSSHP